jgi:predicted dehydrogenase
VAAVRVVVIGLGGIADAHLRKLRWIDDVEVVGVCDLSPTLASAVAQRFGVPHADADAERMLADLEPEAVHVLTPPAAHRRLVQLALSGGAHVLVEKPIATTREDYAAMRDAALAAGRLLVEDFNYRFQGVTLRALDLLHAGAVGRPVAVDVTMNVGLSDPSGPYADTDVPHFAHELPGGALFNFASHPASIVTAILGPHDCVRAWRRRLAPGALSDDELRALAGAGDACAAITLTSHAQPPRFTLAVRGTRGTLELDVFAGRLHVANRAGRVGRLVDELRVGAELLGHALAGAGRAATGRNVYVEGLGTLLERFYAAVRRAGPPPVTLEEMDAANALLFDLFEDDNRL